MGLEVRFRAGSLIKADRDYDFETKKCIGNWNGRHRKVEDHTWTEITFKPSFLTRVVDLSFKYLNVPIEVLYSLQGFHISERNQCNALPTQKLSEKDFDEEVSMCNHGSEKKDLDEFVKQRLTIDWFKLITK